MTMKKHLFDDFVVENSITGAKMEAKRLIDIRDAKWGHPELEENWWNPFMGFCGSIYTQDVPLEQRIANKVSALEMHHAAFPDVPVDESFCKVDKYTVPGCPEEPDTQAEVWVYTPANAKKQPCPVLRHGWMHRTSRAGSVRAGQACL